MDLQHELVIPGAYHEIGAGCDFVAQGAGEAGFGEDAVFRLTLACDEALTNVIEHAYGGEGRGEIRITWATNPREFVVTIRDFGQPFQPEAVEAPLSPGVDTDPASLRVGGLGMHIMRKVMDRILYRFDPAEGNLLTMSLKLPSGSTA